ncbi:MAG: hypothetical protein AMJ41_01570 [candidate division Zixibacteria bacterium DG_27]|nr:MAG: hypothetical protein AMJ41_01570 [candidate division Zixibacteria bacterium DG_27]
MPRLFAGDCFTRTIKFITIHYALSFEARAKNLLHRQFLYGIFQNQFCDEHAFVCKRDLI